MKGLLFFLILLGVAFLAWSINSKDGFQDIPPSVELNVPLVSPRYKALTGGNVQPFAPPSTALLAPPPGESASVNTQPAEDPAMQKATSGRIENVFQSLMGFFKTDATGLEKIGDPSIQLPLTTARSDRIRLKDELNVLARNPGLESSLTSEDVDGIEANLGYLQRKWRMSVNSLSGSPIEGFQTSTPTATTTTTTAPATTTAAPATTTTAPATTTTAPATTTMPPATTTMPPATTTAPPATGKSNVTLKHLEELSLKVNVEIIRLQRSGTTDINTQSRINVLSSIRKTVDGIIDDVRKGIRQEKDIPLMKEDIDKFLPAIENPNTAIPNLFNDKGVSSVLNSLFPKYGIGDISGAKLSQQIFDEYGKAFLTNLSWDVSLSYKGKAEQDIAKNYAKAAEDVKLSSGEPNTNLPLGSPQTNTVDTTSYRGLLDSVVTSMTGMPSSDSSVSVNGSSSSSSTTTTGTFEETIGFNWKERSKQICAQVKARGYEPYDFGCLTDPDSMRQESFSWRGYTRMICTRLNTIYDTSVPFLCGCPPPTWPGWRQ